MYKKTCMGYNATSGEANGPVHVHMGNGGFEFTWYPPFLHNCLSLKQRMSMGRYLVLTAERCTCSCQLCRICPGVAVPDLAYSAFDTTICRSMNRGSHIDIRLAEVL